MEVEISEGFAHVDARLFPLSLGPDDRHAPPAGGIGQSFALGGHRGQRGPLAGPPGASGQARDQPRPAGNC